MATRTLFAKLRCALKRLARLTRGVTHSAVVRCQSGEGVISTAIVVLVIAFLAVGMWVAFKVIMGNATTSISNQVSQLGQ